MRRLEARLSRDAAACPETIDTGEIVNMQYLRDGSLIQLYQLESGDDTVTPENIPSETLDFERFDPEGEYTYVYHRSDPNQVVQALIDLIDTYHLVVDLPIVFDPDGVVVTVIGEAENIQAAYDTIPDPIKQETTVEQITRYSPVARGLHTQLTSRQRQVLKAAFEVGYYDVPREATAADIADQVDCSPSTASEHLRKIEASVMSVLATA